MQMYPVTSPDIVLMCGIDKQVRICACIHTSLYERKCMLRYTSIVMIIMDQ